MLLRVSAYTIEQTIQWNLDCLSYNYQNPRLSKLQGLCFVHVLLIRSVQPDYNNIHCI